MNGMREARAMSLMRRLGARIQGETQQWMRADRHGRPHHGVGQSASSEAIAARCLSLVELALSTGDS